MFNIEAAVFAVDGPGPNRFGDGAGQYQLKLLRFSSASGAGFLTPAVPEPSAAPGMLLGGFMRTGMGLRHRNNMARRTRAVSMPVRHRGKTTVSSHRQANHDTT